MANEFQLVSQDDEAKYEMKTLGEMCRVKLFMDSYIKDGNKDDEEIISTLASLVPTMDKAKIKRHYGKIHSMKTPDNQGFVKSNGKIKYGHVGINEKVNSSIHKNRSSFAQKRQEAEIEEFDEVVMVNSIKVKIAVALTNIKELALQQVSSIFTELETSVSDMLEDDLFISDPDATREKTVITDDILNSIKDILNSNIDFEFGGCFDEQTTLQDVTEAPTVASVDEVEELEEIPTDDIFQEEIVDYPAPAKKYAEEDIFQIFEEINEELGEEAESAVDISSEPTAASEDAIVQEVYPEVPTDGFPIVESGGEDDEFPVESSSAEVSDDDEDEYGDDEVDEGPHHGVTPEVQPETPVINPSKPHRPWKIGWKVQPELGDHKEVGHRRPTVIQAINKLFEDNKYTPSTTEEAAQLYKPYKKWMMKKSDYVVSNELLNENISPSQAEDASAPFYNEYEEGQSIKLNNIDNHRDNNEEEPTEIGAKKVSFVNSVHPTKPSLNFRNSEEERKRELQF